MKNKAIDAENAAKLNQIGTLYKITKQLCNDRAAPPAGVCSKNGNLLTQEDLVRERWKAHFQEVLNRPAPTHQIIPEDCVLAEDEDCLDIDTGPFTLEEVRAAIKHLKNVKPPGSTVLMLRCQKPSQNLLQDICALCLSIYVRI